MLPTRHDHALEDAADRLAVVIVALRKTTLYLHRRCGHRGEWQTCDDPICRRNVAAIDWSHREISHEGTY